MKSHLFINGTQSNNISTTTSIGYTYPFTTTIPNNYYTTFTQPAPITYTFTAPVNKRLSFIRLKSNFSKYELMSLLGHLPDDVTIVNCFFDTLSNSTVFMLSSQKFTECGEGTNIPEIIINGETWDYKLRADFANRIEE